MGNSILILANGKINPIFINANRLILSKYSDQISQGKTHSEKIAIIEKLWEKDHRATLKQNEKSHWESINFQSLEDMIFFSLKNR